MRRKPLYSLGVMKCFRLSPECIAGLDQCVKLMVANRRARGMNHTKSNRTLVIEIAVSKFQHELEIDAGKLAKVR